MINKVQGTSFSVTSSLGMAMEGRRALLLKLCSGRIHLRAGGRIATFTRTEVLPLSQPQGHGRAKWISDVLQQFPGGGKEMRLHFCNLKMSYLPQALPLPLPGLTFIFFLFSLFFHILSFFCHYSHYCAILHIKHCPSAY